MVLLGEAERIDPNRRLREMDWIRGELPWLSLAILPPRSLPPPAFAGLVTRLCRHGAAVIAEDSRFAADVAHAVTDAFDPVLDLPRWLGYTVPEWRGAARQRAVRAFRTAFESITKEARAEPPPPPSHQPLWTRVGRAIRAAHLVQKRSTEPLWKVSAAADYGDFRSMDRALFRLFGIFSRDLRGTAGWEWLLWRFLSGLGDGKERRWNQ